MYVHAWTYIHTYIYIYTLYIVHRETSSRVKSMSMSMRKVEWCKQVKQSKPEVCFYVYIYIYIYIIVYCLSRNVESSQVKSMSMIKVELRINRLSAIAC